MRGKVAKRLRAEAKKRTKGHPPKAQSRNPQTGAIENLFASARGLYRSFKKSFKKGLIK